MGVSAFSRRNRPVPGARAELADALDQPVDGPDRSNLLRLLIRLGLRTAAPEHVDALREAVREQAAGSLQKYL